MILLNPKQHQRFYADERSKEIMLHTIGFFEQKGKRKLKEDDHNRTWYADFLEFQKNERAFATLLTPAGYGEPDDRWDTWRNCEFNEILAFYGLAYWYTWQVSILGLGPIWQSENEALKQRAAKLLQDGEVFAFGLSERAHGADIYATEMRLTPQPDGSYRANGEKYYIGNGNIAPMVSTFGKMDGIGRLRLLCGRLSPSELRPDAQCHPQPIVRGAICLARLSRNGGAISSPEVRQPGMQPSTRSTSVNTTWAGHRLASARTPSTKPSTTRLTGACMAWL